jgi:multiple sugar transport system ATP-binding protein
MNDEEKEAVKQATLPEESRKIEKSLLKKLSKAKEIQVPPDLAFVSIRHVNKVYDKKVQAVSDFNLEIHEHEFVVLVGPSGCGKSTTLRMIAGLEQITSGQLWIDGNYANNLPPKDRELAMCFQSYALYPHMSVYDNMAFGLKMRKVDRVEIDKRVREAAKILQIETLLDRRPKALSGGQRQRVALGRALVRHTKLFLMDEPLSNLDAKLRVQMRAEIVKLHETQHATTIYVTHDQTEAMTMATRIVVMKDGRIQQVGAPLEIYSKPKNLFVATFIGSPSMNILKARYNDGLVTFTDGHSIKLPAAIVKAHKKYYEDHVEFDRAQIASIKEAIASLDKQKPEKKPEIDRIKKIHDDLDHQLEGFLKEVVFDQNAKDNKPHEIAFGIRPENIHLHPTDPANPEEAFQVTVTVAELLGHEYYLHTDFGGIDLVFKVPVNNQVIHMGDKITIYFHTRSAHLFDTICEERVY